MQIILRILLTPAQKQLIVLSEFWEVLQKSGASLDTAIIDLEWPSENTKRILQTISGNEITLWHAFMLFDKKELNKYSLFELVTTQVVNISHADNKLFDAGFSSDLPILKKRSHKIPSRIIASTIKLSENNIASYGGFSRELIASRYVVDLLSKCDLYGWFTQDVYKRDSTVHALHHRLNAKNLTEVVSFDVSVRKMMGGLSEATLSRISDCALNGDLADEDSIKERLIARFGERQELDVFRYWGCKTLMPEDVPHIEDFSRLGDSELSYMMTGWVVSQKTRAAIVGHKLKGVKFRPVLISGSEFHDKYLELWHGAIAFLCAHGVTYDHAPLKL